MKVTIKDFNVDMEIRNNGIEFEVYSPDGTKHLGDLILTKSKLEWCKGRTRAGNGVSKSWDEFIELMK
jgi:hypothetical protein